MIGREPNEDNVEYCTLDHFSKLNQKELLPFIFARHPDYTSPSKLPDKSKGTLDEATAGVEKTILVAYNARFLRSKLQGVPDVVVVTPQGGDDTNAATNAAANAGILQVVVSPRSEVCDAILPSAILANQQKIDCLFFLFDHRSNMLPLEVTDVLKAKADRLFSALRGRLRTRIQLRGMVESKREYWCLVWAEKNLSVVAAYMVLFGHVKEDIYCLSEMSCLLSPSPNNFLLCTNAEADLQGCYLYRDTNDNVWVQSGKATGKSFRVVHEEYLKKAAAPCNPSNSTFVDAYPSRGSQRAGTSMSKYGFFEYLQQHVAVAFNPDANISVFSKDYDAGGLFHFTDDEKKSITNTNFDGRGVDGKFAEMAAYLFQLGYHLAISPRNNKPDSPNFEACGINRL